MTQLFRIILNRKMKGKQKTIHRHRTTNLALALKKACTYRLCDLRVAFFEHINVLNHIQEAWNIQESCYFPLLWKPFYRSKKDSTNISKYDFSIKPCSLFPNQNLFEYKSSYQVELYTSAHLISNAGFPCCFPIKTS